jgi:REP element-mobilizing transposase RayT
MPLGLVRYQQAGDLHFVTFSCYHRLAYLETHSARELFERSLETVRLRYRLFVTGYVVMPEHVHLPVSEPLDGTLARALQAPSGSAVTMISMYALRRSASKSFATCTAILSFADWWQSPTIGHGQVSTIMLPVSKAQWR